MPSGSTIGRRLPPGRDRFADYGKWNSEVGRLLDKALAGLSDTSISLITEVFGSSAGGATTTETLVEDVEVLAMMAFNRADEP